MMKLVKGRIDRTTDDQIMCQICFKFFDLNDLHKLSNGKYEDVCENCWQEESFIMDKYIDSIEYFINRAKRIEEKICSPKQNPEVSAAEYAKANNARLIAICKKLGIDN